MQKIINMPRLPGKKTLIKNSMHLKKCPQKTVLAYVKKYSTESKSEDRRQSMSALLDMIETKEITVLFGFVSEYGEKAIAVKKSDGTKAWAGDESDWNIVTFGEEQYFVEIN